MPVYTFQLTAPPREGSGKFTVQAASAAEGWAAIKSEVRALYEAGQPMTAVQARMHWLADDFTLEGRRVAVREISETES